MLGQYLVEKSQKKIFVVLHPKKQIYQIKLEIFTIVYSVLGFGVQLIFTEKLIFEKGVPVSK